MTNREKELRTKIGAECLYKGSNWRSDYLTSCEEDKYDFIRCPDDFECLQDYMKDFIWLCNEYELC